MNRPDTPSRIIKLCYSLKGILFAALMLTALSSGLWLINISMVQYFIDDIIPSITPNSTDIEIKDSQINHIRTGVSVYGDFSDHDIQLILRSLDDYSIHDEQKIDFVKNLVPALRTYPDQTVAEIITVAETPYTSNFLKTLITYLGISLNARSFVYLIMGLFILFGLSRGVGIYLSTLFGQKFVWNLRRIIFGHLQNLDLAFYEDKKTGGIMSWFTNDINVFRTFAANQLNSFIENFVLVFGALISLFFINWQLALVSFGIVPVLAFVISYAGNAMRRRTRNVQDKLADISAVLQEVVSATQIIRSFGTENHEINRFENENRETFNAEMNKAKVSAFLQPAIQIVVAVGIMVILLKAIDQLSVGGLTTGQLIVFIGFLVLVSERGKRLGQTYANLNELFSAGDRLFEFLDQKQNIVQIDNPVIFDEVKGDVEFKNVSFSYDDGEQVLKNIDLIVPSGRIVAIVGPSGAGKSSLIKLIPRFYDVDFGSILVDDVDIRHASIESLRKQISIVPQDTILFSTTIKENISYGRFDASFNQIVDAAKMANAHEFIENLPDGYNTLVGERGSKLSGGQAQRISIARAILNNPRILILDEATSSLDAQSEELVQQALQILMQGRTTFIIAHRLSTIQNAHEIIVLQNGVIVQRGVHNDLMKIDGLYKNLYHVQIMKSSESS